MSAFCLMIFSTAVSPNTDHMENKLTVCLVFFLHWAVTRRSQSKTSQKIRLAQGSCVCKRYLNLDMLCSYFKLHHTGSVNETLLGKTAVQVDFDYKRKLNSKIYILTDTLV